MSAKSSGLAAYKGHIISPVDETNFFDWPEGCIVVDEAGVIKDVGDWNEINQKYASELDVIDYGKQIIMPGLIDLHIHLVQIAQTGRSGDTLLGWLNKYIFPAENKFSRKEHASKL